MKTLDPIKVLVAVAIYLLVLFLAKLVLWPLISSSLLRISSSLGAGLDGLAISLGIFACIVVASIASSAFLAQKSETTPINNSIAVGVVVLVYKLIQPDLSRAFDPYPFLLAVISGISIVVITAIIKHKPKGA
jgi:hypothetical protein